MTSETSNSTDTVRLEIQGMHCAACVSRVEAALKSVPGVESASVNLPLGSAQVRFLSSASPDPEACVAAVEKIGYQASPSKSSSRQDQAQYQLAELRNLRIRVLLAIPATVIVMVVHMGHVHFPGVEATLALLSAFVLFGCGWSIVVRGLNNLVRLTPDMDSLVSLGAVAAWVTSLVAWLVPDLWTDPPMFFEAAATVIGFVLLGRYLEQRARRETLSATEALLQLQPQVASRWQNGTESQVPVDSLQPGDVVRIRPGERIPVDGLILEGTASVDQAMVTGESMPVSRTEGDEVLAGTMNLSGSMLVKISRTGEATFLQQVAGLVRDAQGTKAPVARLADRIAGIFVPIVLLISLLTLAAWLALGPRENAASMGILAAITVLVISCPCALGLATPTAIATSMGRAAQLGLLIRDGATLEQLASVDTVVFDKTGTLTRGEFSVHQVLTTPEFSSVQLQQLTAALEVHSEHPLAKAIVTHVRAQSPRPAETPTPGLFSLGMYSTAVDEGPVDVLSEVKQFNSHSGLGASGKVEGNEVLAGSERFLKEQGINTSSLQDILQDTATRGGSCVLVAVNGRAAGAFELMDIVRPDAPRAVAELQAMGLDVQLLTGDRIESAQAVSQKLGISQFHAQVLPADKARVVRQLQQAGRVVVMVGDGVNDAPVLATADVGMAMGAGTDVAQAAAPVKIASRQLTSIPAGLGLARQTLRIVKQNLGLAFVYNVIGIPLAAGLFYPLTGWLLPPMFAAAAMSLSSVSVVMNSLRLRSYSAPD